MSGESCCIHTLSDTRVSCALFKHVLSSERDANVGSIHANCKGSDCEDKLRSHAVLHILILIPQ